MFRSGSLSVAGNRLKPGLLKLLQMKSHLVWGFSYDWVLTQHVISAL